MLISKKSRFSHFVVLSLILLMGIISFLAILKYSGLTQFNQNSIIQPNEGSVRPVNDIDYSPASPTDNDDINNKKQSGQLGNDETSVPATTDESIDVSFTSTGQDTPKGPLIIRAMITNATAGACKLSLSRDSITKTFNSSIKAAGTYYTCDGFDIATSELSTGEWSISLTVTSGNRSGVVSASSEISL